MIGLFLGYIPTRVIYVAAKLGIGGGARAPELAEKLSVHSDALYRVLRTLAALGVLHQDEDDRFFVTELGETLRADSPQSVRDYAIYSHEFSYDRMSKILDSVRTGKPVIEDFFGNLRANPAEEAVFYAGSGNKSRIEAAAIIEAYDFSKCGKLVRECCSNRNRQSKQRKRGAAGRCPDVSLSREISSKLSQPAAIPMP
jgi:hypothetical protein